MKCKIGYPYPRDSRMRARAQRTLVRFFGAQNKISRTCKELAQNSRKKIIRGYF